MYRIKKDMYNYIVFTKRLQRREVAKGADISIDTLSSWLYRGTKTNYARAKALADFLEVEITEIFERA